MKWYECNLTLAGLLASVNATVQGIQLGIADIWITGILLFIISLFYFIKCEPKGIDHADCHRDGDR